MDAVITLILNSLFGCSHRRTTFPITPARRAGFSNSNKGMYVVCTDCGKEFGYNWADMKVIKQSPPTDVVIPIEAKR
jgi:hypothetical protein